MKIKNLFLVLCMLCGLTIAANAQVSFKGKKSGAAKTFKGNADGETKIGIKTVGKLPKMDYEFVANLDEEFANFVSITDAILDFGKVRKANLLATLTEAGQAELAAQGELLIPFTVDFFANEEQTNPGFNQLPGTINYIESIEPGTGGLGVAATILLGQEGDLECPIGAIAAEQGGNLFSLLTAVTPRVFGTVTTTLDFLDDLAEAGDGSIDVIDKRPTTAQVALENANLSFKASKKFAKYAKLKFNEGSGAGNFSLENVSTTLGEADEQGNVMISFTADLPATLDFKKNLVRSFVENKENAKALLNGESIAESEVNLENSMSIKAGFKFKKAKATLFEANKAEKFNIIFTASGEE